MPNTIHLIFKTEDTDLQGWKAVLPHRTFNKTVNEILLAESKGEIAVIPFEFSSTENNKPLSCVIRIADEKIARFVRTLPKGAVMENIKNIIRKHIRKNKEMPPKEVGILVELLVTKIEDLKKVLIKNTNYYAGEHDENRRLKVVYSNAVGTIFNNILDCYLRDDEETGDSVLQNLEIEQIVDIEFLLMFDEVFKLLQFGIPDEEFESIISLIKEREKSI